MGEERREDHAAFTLHTFVDGRGGSLGQIHGFSPGCITKAISLDSVFACICITRSD